MYIFILIVQQFVVQLYNKVGNNYNQSNQHSERHFMCSGILTSNRKISIILLISSILIQLLFIVLLIIKLVSRGLQSIPNISTPCVQYLQTKYQSLLTINSLTNSFLFIGMVLGILPILSSIFLFIKNREEQQTSIKSYNISVIIYVCLSIECLISLILFGYEFAFKIQADSCQLTFSIYTALQFVFSLILVVLCLAFLHFYVYLLLMLNKDQQDKEGIQKINRQQQQLASQFQKKSKQVYESLLNKNQFKFDPTKNDLKKQKQQNQIQINVQNPKQHLKDKLQLQSPHGMEDQNLKDNTIYHDKSQFQSLKSQGQPEEQTPRFVQQKINELKQIGFQMEYGDTQNKIKLSKGYMIPQLDQDALKPNKYKVQEIAYNQKKCINVVVNIDKNNNPSVDLEIMSVRNSENQDQIILFYAQTKQQKQIKKAKKRQVKRKLIQMKICKQQNQLCPLLGMIQQDQINQQQTFQKRIFQQKNQLKDFTIGAELCLFKPKYDQFQKDNEDKMQEMYAQTMVCYKQQYMDKKQYEQRLATASKQTNKNKGVFKNSPINFLIQSNMTSKSQSKAFQKNKKQRKKMLEQMRGKRAVEY